MDANELVNNQVGCFTICANGSTEYELHKTSRSDIIRHGKTSRYCMQKGSGFYESKEYLFK